MFKNPRKNIVYLVVLFIPFYLYFNRNPFFPSIRHAVAAVISSPKVLFTTPLLEIKKILYYRRVFNEYKRLSRENDVLRARLTGKEDLIKENNRLNNLLNFKKKLIYPSVAARVIGREPSNWNTAILIDRGKEDGVEDGMPVVTDLGIVGKIAEITDSSSKVILLTDYRFSVAAGILSSRESGLVSGTLQGLCRMRYLSKNAQIQEGDTVVTSKLSSTYPEGLLIGEVVSVYQNPDTSSVECLIRPAVSLSQVEEVIVILNKK